MTILAGVAILLGLIALVAGLLQRRKAGRLLSTPLVRTGEAARGPAPAGANAGVSVEGAVQCAELLVAPITGTACLAYEYSVQAYWREGDQQQSRVVAREGRAAPFAIDDGSGPVGVDASQGGDYEMRQSFTETRGVGILLPDSVLRFGNLQVISTLPAGGRFQVFEKVLEPPPRLFVCGALREGGLIGAPGWSSLILSTRSREELLAAATRQSRAALRFGAVALGAGAVLGIVSRLL
jgi:hypothetical protein